MLILSRAGRAKLKKGSYNMGLNTELGESGTREVTSVIKAFV